MSLKKVFNVCVDYKQIPPHLRGIRFTQVEKDIRALAKQENEPVVFHKFVDEHLLGGGPSVLVEMSEEFAEKVKKVQHVTDLIAPHLPTEPRPLKVNFKP